MAPEQSLEPFVALDLRGQGLGQKDRKASGANRLQQEAMEAGSALHT